jgi:hypothetical protein
MPIGKLRAAFLASAALTALCLPPAQSAQAGPDPCTVTGSPGAQTATCSGDQSDGVSTPNITELIVRDLVSDITPVEGQYGIAHSVVGSSSITTVDTSYRIITTGDGALGIDTISAFYTARVVNNADITTTGAGSDAISAYNWQDGAGEVVNSGDLTVSGANARAAYARGGVDASVINTGVVTASGRFSNGLTALAGSGLASATNNGSLTNSGTDVMGINAVSDAGDARAVNTGSITMTGLANWAIFVQGDDSAEVQNDGSLTLNGQILNGIDARASGSVLVTSTGDITATGLSSTGISAASTNQGSATIDNSGDISIIGGYSRALWATTAFGDTNVTNSGTISNTGPDSGSLGIGAFANTGSVTVENSGMVATAGGHAIMATTASGDIDITNDALLTAGRDGIYAGVFNDGNADIVNRGDISGGSGGIRVRAAGGDVSIFNTAHVGTSGDSAIEANSRNAAASVENHGEIESAGRGILAFGRSSAIVRNSGNVTATGDSATAIDVLSEGIARVENDGNVVSTGNFSAAIAAGSSITETAEIVNKGNLTTFGASARGISATASNGVSVENHGVVITGGDYARAINAFVSVYGDANVVNTNDLTTTGQMADGITATVGMVAQPGSASIYNSGNISIAQSAPGQSSAAIAARVARGDIDITNYNALRTGAGGTGISATIVLSGNITINADSGRADGTGGIFADSVGIRATVNTGDVSIFSVGDVAAGQGGIDAYAKLGDISITSYGNIESRGGSAIVATAAQQGSVTVHNTGNLTAAKEGIDGFSGNGDATIVNAGDISAAGQGARAIHLASRGTGVAAITSTGRITAAGDNSRGIAAEVYDGIVLNVENQGDIHVAGAGAYGMRLTANGSGSINLIARGSITAEGGSNYGIAAGSMGGDVTVDAQADFQILGHDGRGIAVTGINASVSSNGNLLLGGDNAAGIIAAANIPTIAGDPGTARIASAGAVTMTGANAVALQAESLYGDAEVLVGAGTVTGGSGQGGAGIELFAAGAARLENRGIIQSLNDRAIVNDPGSGPATIDNFNMIIGSVSLNDGEDSLANRGLFEARGDSDFGSGTDEMVNSGTLRVSDSGGADQVTILGLESFTNGPAGLITMVDGRTGDRLTLPALTAFNGGGAIALDAALAGTGSPADLLTVSGVVSGTTLVAVNNVARSSGVRGADDIFIIDQGSRPRGDEFRQLVSIRY